MASEIQPDQLLQRLLARGPARLLTGAAGPCYRTGTQLALRVDHAAAIDAVHRELDLSADLGTLARQYGLFEARTQARDRAEYLLRPDLGRRLDDGSVELLRQRCPTAPDLQILVGDGLSATAMATQVPVLLPLLLEKARTGGWKLGQPFVVRQCRVGILNAVGEVLRPTVAVLLIGERPGLATAESLSAYLAHRPRPWHTDAERNLISNIHAAGVQPSEAVERILALCDRMRALGTSGVSVKEQFHLPGALPAEPVDELP